MRLTLKTLAIAILIGFGVFATACKKKDVAKPAAGASPSPGRVVPGPEDIRVASHAMNVQDVLLMLKQGYRDEAIIAEVKRRRIVDTIVEANELQLSAWGARRELLTALKDKRNRLTEAQEQAYGKLMLQSNAGRFPVAPGQHPPK